MPSKVSALTTGGTPQGTDELHVARSATDRKLAVSGLLARSNHTGTLPASAGALMDSECTSLADVKALNQSVISGAAPTFAATNITGTPTSLVGTNITGTAAGLTVGATTGVEAGADVTDTANVTAAGALMDSECTSLADVKALNQSVISGAAPTFVGTNITGTAAGLTVGATTGVEAGADVTDTANVTAAGALMDSECTSLADVKALNQSVISGAAPTFAATNFTALPEFIAIACSDETTDLTTGTAKATFRMPFALTLTEVRASVTTAPVGSTLIVDINDGGTTIMTTNKLSIDASEKTSETAATAPGITDTALADDAEITIDIDQVGSTTAGAGLKVYIIGTRT
jgi:hypothetical protein